MNWKIIALAMAILVVAIGAIVFLQQIQSHFNQPNPSPTPSPTETPEPFVVTTVTASPSNDTPGLVTVLAEVKNNQL
jgi:divalent metal cation (Fe/Co/Zn/Cd) transporter